jgi:P pilus assembly chaperone PapD
MLKSIIIVLSFVILPVFLSAQPKMEIIGGETKDWGRVTLKQSPVKHKLVIKNVGNQQLKIVRVKPTCGCTTAPVNKDELKPGESTTIDVSMSVQGVSGKMHKQIGIETNDPERPYVNFMLMADVVMPLTVSPTTYLPFKDLQVGVETQAKLKIKNTSEGNITLSEIKTNIPELKVNLKSNQVLKPGQEVELVASIKPSKSGNLSARINIKTNSSEIPELVINGFGKVEPSPFFNN